MRDFATVKFREDLGGGGRGEILQGTARSEPTVAAASLIMMPQP
jgi:hypothetical protein